MKKMATGAVIAAVLMILLSLAAAGAGSYKNTRFLSDGRGGFYEFNYDESGYCLYAISSSGERKESFHGSQSMRGISLTDGQIILISAPKTTQPLFISDGQRGQSVVFLADIDLSGELVAADRQRNIYAVDKGSPKQIRCYNSRGAQTGTIDAGFTVANLFSDSEGNIWASGRGGCISLPTGQLYKGAVPAGRFYLSGDYCAADDGSLYRFSGGSFELLGKYPRPFCCTADGKIYSAAGRTLTLLDDEGNAAGTLNTGADITGLYASGNTGAYICSGELHIIRKGDLAPPTATQSSIPGEVSDKPHTSAPESSAPQTSSPQSSAGTKRLESNVYDLSGQGGYIYITQGTTAAAFRDNISCDGYELCLTSPTGGSITSGKLGTGIGAVFTCGGESRRYTLILPGDLTGEGNINSRDKTALSDILLGKNDPDDVTATAADLNSNGSPDICDLVLLSFLADGRPLPSAGKGGNAEINITTDSSPAPGKAFYVYLTVSSDSDMGAALGSLSYDPALLRLTSAKLTDKQGGDTLRTSEEEGEIRLLVGSTANMTRRTAAIRFEPLSDNAGGYNFTARLISAADKEAAAVGCAGPAELRVNTQPAESSAVSAAESKSKTSKQASERTSKETSSKSQTSRKENSSKDSETHNNEDEEEESRGSVTLPEVSRPEDPSKRYLLIAGVAVLILGAGAGGYALARRRK